MNRRETLLGLLALGSLPSAAAAQTSGKTYRVGLLSGAAAPRDGLAPAPLRAALRALGYGSGKHAEFIMRFADGKMTTLPDLVAELLPLEPDAIVTIGSQATAAAARATATIPIVMFLAGDAVAMRTIASLARPGGNITGFNDEAAGLTAKRMEILKETIPTARRIAILWNAADPAMTLRSRAVEGAASVLRVQVEPLTVRKSSDFPATFAAVTRMRPDALYVVSDPLTSVNTTVMLDFVDAHRLPAMYELNMYVEAGGLLSYGPNVGDVWQIVARDLDRIFNGTEPADIPAEQATRYELAINLKAARALGLTLPPSLLVRADEVIPL